MALYSTVDEGYDVEVFKSFSSLWKSACAAHYHTDPDQPLWLDSAETTRLTQASLKAELKKHGVASIYESECNDWTLKVRQH